MPNRWRIVATTAAVVIGTASMGSAQTVYLRNAPAASNVEVVVNGASAGQSVVDAEGEAKVAFTLPDGKTQMDSNVFVDNCSAVRKVVIVDRARLPPPPAEGCDRREIPGIYWMRPVNTVVVDVGGATPTLLLIKGSYTPPKPVAEGAEEEKTTHPLPKGLMMFAGGAYAKYRDIGTLSCGNVSACDPKTGGLTYTFGADFWITKFLGVEGTYLRPREVQVAGTATAGAPFLTTLDNDVWTVAGKLGVQAGIVRIYGKGGFNYHQATNTSTQTIDGLTQKFAYTTSGWDWVFGAGMEAWIGTHQRMAIYADGGFMRIKGKAESGGEAMIDDRLKYLAVGVKLRIGR